MNRIYTNRKIYLRYLRQHLHLSFKLPRFCRQINHTLNVWVYWCLPKPCYSQQTTFGKSTVKQCFGRTQWFLYIYINIYNLPESNSSHLKIGHLSKGKDGIYLASIFSCYVTVSFREGFSIYY